MSPNNNECPSFLRATAMALHLQLSRTNPHQVNISRMRTWIRSFGLHELFVICQSTENQAIPMTSKTAHITQYAIHEYQTEMWNKNKIKNLKIIHFFSWIFSFTELLYSEKLTWMWYIIIIHNPLTYSTITITEKLVKEWHQCPTDCVIQSHFYIHLARGK